MSDRLPGAFETMALLPEARENPYPLLEKLRSECPVHRDDVAGLFMLTRHADARAILSDNSLHKDPDKTEQAAYLARFRRGAVPDGLIYLADSRSTILDMDDPGHERIRTPLVKALYARAARFRPEVERIVDEAIAKLEGKESFDIVSEFSVPVPVDVIASLLGVDLDRMADFRNWSEGVVQTFNHARTPEQTAWLVRSANELGTYMLETMAARKANPQDDLVTDMMKLQAEGAPLTDGEISVNLQMLLVGGNLTTADLISNGIRLFLAHPDQRAKLLENPTLAAPAVEEVLRFDGPVDLTVRVTPREMEVGGCPVHATQVMGVSLRGANRDPEVFENPDKFDITRKPAPHLAFGGGSHICVGAPLARMEAQVAFVKLLQRFPNLRLKNPDAPLKWRALPMFRGLESLELRT